MNNLRILNHFIKIRYGNGFSSAAYVPKSNPCSDEELSLLIKFLDESRKVLVLTGAGISTESGIPDYRSEGVGLYARSKNRPVQIQQFLSSEETRRRYWARNYVGWPRFSSVIPNATHLGLSRWESLSKRNLVKCTLGCVVTQNVDGLHQKAGSQSIVELHGSAFAVSCLSCGSAIDRHQLQERMQSENHQLLCVTPPSQLIRPDGDVELPSDFVETFITPKCWECGGILKPDIVFFGDNVPRPRVDYVYQQLSSCDALLVLGSSLQVYSGYRFALEAKEKKIRIAIVNIGFTRADHLANLKLSGKCGEIMDKLSKFYFS